MVGGGGPCDFSVSPWSKPFFFLFLGTFIRLGGLLGQGLGLGLGQRLDNYLWRNERELSLPHSDPTQPLHRPSLFFGTGLNPIDVIA